MGIFPYIGLIYGRYLQFRFLKWPLTCVYHAFRGFPVDFRGSHICPPAEWLRGRWMVGVQFKLRHDAHLGEMYPPYGFTPQNK